MKKLLMLSGLILLAACGEKKADSETNVSKPKSLVTGTYAPHLSIEHYRFQNEKNNLVLLMTLKLQKKFQQQVEPDRRMKVTGFDENGREKASFIALPLTPEGDSVQQAFYNGEPGDTLQTAWVYSNYGRSNPGDVEAHISYITMEALLLVKENKSVKGVYEGETIFDMDKFLNLMENDIAVMEKQAEKAGNDPLTGLAVVGHDISFYQDLVIKNAKKLSGDQYKRYHDLSSKYIAILSRVQKNARQPAQK